MQNNLKTKISKLIKKPIIIPRGISLYNCFDRFLIVYNPNTKKIVKVDIKLRGFNGIKLVNKTRLYVNSIGTYFSTMANTILDAHRTYKLVVQVTGVGFKAYLLERFMIFRVGLSHKLFIELPEDIKVIVAKKRPIVFVFKTISRTLLTQATSIIMRFKPQEPYKGKGIHFSNSNIKRKDGKKTKQ